MERVSHRVVSKFQTRVRVYILRTYSRKQVSQKCAKLVRGSVRGSKGSGRAETILAEGFRGRVRYFIENLLGIKTTAQLALSPYIGVGGCMLAFLGRNNHLKALRAHSDEPTCFAAC